MAPRCSPSERGGRQAWVFPGQGSQQVGMGHDLCEAFPAARRLFQEADETLGLPLSRLCFEGPEETLRQTINAQPAIMTVSLACLEAALEGGCLQERPAAFMAGHSLGEYTALVAAGALTFGDGLRLVRERGRLMQEAGDRVPGAMAAIIGLPEDKVMEVCYRTRAEVCNFNSPGQVVIGGTCEAVERAIAEARARGARQTIPLNVSGAFHSSLMRPAAEGMAQAIGQTSLADAQVPIVANSTAQPITSAQAIKEELLRQLHRPVLWQRSVEYMIAQGVTTFVEIGPGRVLTSLIRRIDGSARTMNIGDASSIKGEIDPLTRGLEAGRKEGQDSGKLRPSDVAMAGKRRKARIIALKALYEADSVGHQPQEILSHLLEESAASPEVAAFAQELVAGVLAHRQQIDEVIRQKAPAWPLEQVAVVDRNILRLAIYEMLIDNRVPVRAVINEAVELAKSFGGESSPKFVNGVLGSVSLMATS